MAGSFSARAIGKTTHTPLAITEFPNPDVKVCISGNFSSFATLLHTLATSSP
jgi:hypothetical protein